MIVVYFFRDLGLGIWHALAHLGRGLVYFIKNRRF